MRVEMSDKPSDPNAPGTHVCVNPIDIPIALFQLADVIKAIAWAADSPEVRGNSHQERLYAAAKVFADSHPHDSLSNVLMRWLMEPFDQRNPGGSKSISARLRVIDGGVKD